MKKYNLDSWKKSASDLRDHRSIKVSDETKKLPAKKDTKRWCKGREGTEHQLKIFVKDDFIKTHQLACSVCGKCIAFYWKSGYFKENPPFWAEHELLAKCVIQYLIEMFCWSSK